MNGLAPFVCRLPSRRVLRVRGTDAHEFLQGIFTNDLRRLHPTGSMYGCFLYFTGRVMCDAHLYQCARVHDGQASILVDVHQDSAAELFDHLTEMKMRKRVQLENVGGALAVTASLEQRGHVSFAAAAAASSLSSEGGASIVGSPSLPSPARTDHTTAQTLEERHTECFVDARNFALFPSPPSSRTRKSASEGATEAALDHTPSGAAAAATHVTEVVQEPPPWTWLLKRCVVPDTWAPPMSASDPYDQLLYSRGIGEGPLVFKHNKTLPFEGNMDFLNGVSFHKGCYVGQELTHRTHVMLVTRKRTVPLVFRTCSSALSAAARPVHVGEALYSAEKEKIGEVTGVCGDVGVGLLRLRYVAKEPRTVPGLQLKDGQPVSMTLPDWWPQKEVRKLLKNNS